MTVMLLLELRACAQAKRTGVAMREEGFHLNVYINLNIYIIDGIGSVLLRPALVYLIIFDRLR